MRADAVAGGGRRAAAALVPGGALARIARRGSAHDGAARRNLPCCSEVLPDSEAGRRRPRESCARCCARCRCARLTRCRLEKLTEAVEDDGPMLGDRFAQDGARRADRDCTATAARTSTATTSVAGAAIQEREKVGGRRRRREKGGVDYAAGYVSISDLRARRRGGARARKVELLNRLRRPTTTPTTFDANDATALILFAAIVWPCLERQLAARSPPSLGPVGAVGRPTSHAATSLAPEAPVAAATFLKVTPAKHRGQGGDRRRASDLPRSPGVRLPTPTYAPSPPTPATASARVQLSRDRLREGDDTRGAGPDVGRRQGRTTASSAAASASGGRRRVGELYAQQLVAGGVLSALLRPCGLVDEYWKYKLMTLGMILILEQPPTASRGSGTCRRSARLVVPQLKVQKMGCWATEAGDLAAAGRYRLVRREAVFAEVARAVGLEQPPRPRRRQRVDPHRRVCPSNEGRVDCGAEDGRHRPRHARRPPRSRSLLRALPLLVQHGGAAEVDAADAAAGGGGGGAAAARNASEVPDPPDGRRATAFSSSA